MINKKKYQDLVRGVFEEEKQTKDFLHLTVNENQLSAVSNRLLSSKLSERYYFGGGDGDQVIDFEAYTFRGLPKMEKLVQTATEELKRMSGAAEVNLNCFSGLHGMMSAILVSTKPGDTVMSIPFSDGGHGSTKGIIEALGRKHVFASFDLDKLDFNIEETVKLFKEHKAKAIYIDISVHLNSLKIEKLRQGLGKKATIIYDASHSLGLILAGVFPSPLKAGADLVCANTHKTFPGPQSGIILYKDRQFGEEANWLINTVYVSSVHAARLMVLATSILEYSSFGKKYSEQVIKNSNALARNLVDLGYEVRKANDGSYSQNEQVHLFVDQLGDRVELYRLLIKNNISTNFMQILGGRAFARLGTQEVTRRGMKEKEMEKIAQFLDQALKGRDVKEEVITFTRRFPEIVFSFDKAINLFSGGRSNER